MKIKNYLIIADVHIGITRDLWESGVSLPSQAKKLSNRLNKLKKSTRTEKLIILGDLKHKVPGIYYQEMREVPELLEALNFKKIIITKGNHDGDIEKLIPRSLKKKVSVKKSFTVGDYYFTHGHANADTKKSIIVIGHNQPHIKFRGDVGALYTEPVWVRGYLKKSYDARSASRGKKTWLIIVPAFNELCGATIVNRDGLLGPIAKKLDKKKAHVFLLDGTDMGILDDLKLQEKSFRRKRRR